MFTLFTLFTPFWSATPARHKATGGTKEFNLCLWQANQKSHSVQKCRNKLLYGVRRKRKLGRVENLAARLLLARGGFCKWCLDLCQQLRQQSHGAGRGMTAWQNVASHLFQVGLQMPWVVGKWKKTGKGGEQNGTKRNNILTWHDNSAHKAPEGARSFHRHPWSFSLSWAWAAHGFQ